MKKAMNVVRAAWQDGGDLDADVTEGMDFVRSQVDAQQYRD